MSYENLRIQQLQTSYTEQKKSSHLSFPRDWHTLIYPKESMLINQSINQFISSHTTDIHNLQNQSNENIHNMCNGEYPRSLVLRLYGLPMY